MLPWHKKILSNPLTTLTVFFTMVDTFSLHEYDAYKVCERDVSMVIVTFLIG